MRVWYVGLTEGLGLSIDPSKDDVKAIYQPDPHNQWKWAILFASEALTNKYQRQEITLDNNNFTYRTVGCLLITVHSTPLITDKELGNAFRGFGEVVKIIKGGHKFAKHIDNSRRKIFLTLNNRVQIRDTPGSIRTSDGVRIKLFFQGKLYFCRECGTKHTYTEGCYISQVDQQQPDDQQEQTNTVQVQTNNTVTQPKPETSTSGRNRTNHAPTEQQM